MTVKTKRLTELYERMIAAMLQLKKPSLKQRGFEYGRKNSC